MKRPQRIQRPRRLLLKWKSLAQDGEGTIAVGPLYRSREFEEALQELQRKDKSGDAILHGDIQARGRAGGIGGQLEHEDPVECK